MRPTGAAFMMIFGILLPGSPGCANLDQTGAFVRQWGVRGVGALGAFVLHEGCHLALGAALGAKIDAEFRGGSLYLGFGDLSPKEHQGVAIAGNACTGLAAEYIVDTGAHKKSNLAWGMAAFHAFNTFGYAFSKIGDAEHWSESGGDTTVWKSVNAIHSSRIGTHLAHDSKYGQYLKQRWFGKPTRAHPMEHDPVDFWRRHTEACLDSSRTKTLPGPYLDEVSENGSPSSTLAGPDCTLFPWVANRLPVAEPSQMEADQLSESHQPAPMRAPVSAAPLSEQ